MHEALVGLLQERSWDAVTVQDLCARADVGRSTFYTHFADKEALLAGGFEDFRRLLRAHLGPTARDGGRPLEFGRALLVHAQQQPRLFRAMLGARGGPAVRKRFRAFVLELVKEDLAGGGSFGLRREAATHFVAGALIELLAWSLEGRGAPSPAELGDLFLLLAEPALAAEA